MSGESNRAGWGRRALLAGGAVGLVAAGSYAWWSQKGSQDSEEAVSVALGDIAPGSQVDRWTVVAIHPIRHGAIPIVMATSSGARYQVDILARDKAGPPGIASTDRLSFYLANQGDGESATDEEQGLGVIALARAIESQPERGSELPRLLTMSERAAQHDGGAFGVPL